MTNSDAYPQLKRLPGLRQLQRLARHQRMRCGPDLSSWTALNMLPEPLVCRLERGTDGCFQVADNPSQADCITAFFQLRTERVARLLCYDGFRASVGSEVVAATEAALRRTVVERLGGFTDHSRVPLAAGETVRSPTWLARWAGRCWVLCEAWVVGMQAALVAFIGAAWVVGGPANPAIHTPCERLAKHNTAITALNATCASSRRKLAAMVIDVGDDGGGGDGEDRRKKAAVSVVRQTGQQTGEAEVGRDRETGEEAEDAGDAGEDEEDEEDGGEDVAVLAVPVTAGMEHLLAAPTMATRKRVRLRM